MAVNIHITIIELNALHTKRQNLFQELDAVIHLLMEAKHWGLRKSRNATSLNSRFKSLDTLKDRKSGSAGMPRPISYAVFCLKKKNTSAGLARRKLPTYSTAKIDAMARAAPNTATSLISPIVPV